MRVVPRPAYNEAATIAELLDAVDALPLDKQIVVVDDGSTDDAAAIVERFADAREHVVLVPAERQQRVSDPRARSRTSTARVILIQDADLEYDPVDVPSSDRADRARRRRRRLRLPALSVGGLSVLYFWHLVGNRFLISPDEPPVQHDGLGYGDRLQGLPDGRPHLARPARGRPDRAGDHGEGLQAGLRIYELPIAYYGRTYDEGKKIT